MPNQKRTIGRTDPIHDSARSETGKRRRVTLACDPCRFSREKCDGETPHCGTCLSQSRACSYTPASKKRGVPTGYIRTIELSLAWLFENVPESEKALHGTLIKDGQAAKVIGRSVKNTQQLHKQWTKSRVSKEITRLLTEESSPVQDNPDDDSDNIAEGAGTTITKGKSTTDLETADSDLPGRMDTAQGRLHDLAPAPIPSHTFRLPNHWRRLVDVFFRYTHCWLPLLDQAQILAAGSAYPASGLSFPPGKCTASRAVHAELWAVLAVASFQYTGSSSVLDDSSDQTPNAIFAAARRLLPPELDEWDFSHCRAALLISLVHAGRGKNLTAWMLVGDVARLALHMRSAQQPVSGDSIRLLIDEGSLTQILAACSILDGILSLSVGQLPQRHTDGFDWESLTASFGERNTISETWVPLFGPSSTNTSAAKDFAMDITARPCLTFQQLYMFSRVLNATSEAKVHKDAPPRLTPEDLVKVLHPDFSFCNSLIFEGSTPAMPSAFLVQAMFLTATMTLRAGQRTSLFANLMDALESCIAAMGACGTPPIVVTLLDIARKRGQPEQLHEADHKRSSEILERMKQVWLCASPTPETDQSSPTTKRQTTLPKPGSFDMSQTMLTPAYQNSPDSLSQAMIPTPRYGPSLAEPSGRPTPREPDGGVYAGAAGAPVHPRLMSTGSMGFPAPQIGQGYYNPLVYQPNSNDGQHVDYEAILDELGSIDCSDSADMDPQFMMNLGFAPGCDLGEMFHGQFGG